MRTVAILFADRDSIYKTLPGVEVYDEDRDARTFPGGMPVVAHPPCRTWGKLSHFAKLAPPGEHALGMLAIELARKFGGVVEHPATSRLFTEPGMPRLGQRDKWGGWILPVLQWWFGHKAEKATRLYIVGIGPREIPKIPLRIGEPAWCVSSGYSDGSPKHRKRSRKPEIPRRERSATPPAFAEWLVEVARRAHV